MQVSDASPLSGPQRSQARTLAWQMLCLFDSLGDEFRDQIDRFLNDPETWEDLQLAAPAPEVLEAARQTALRARANQDRYDELLRHGVPEWSIDRMSLVDRNILRLGLHELLESPSLAPAIVMNEAIELARRFGGNESPKFVNGVLDGIRRAQLATR